MTACQMILPQGCSATAECAPRSPDRATSCSFISTSPVAISDSAIPTGDVLLVRRTGHPELIHRCFPRLCEINDLHHLIPSMGDIRKTAEKVRLDSLPDASAGRESRRTF